MSERISKKKLRELTLWGLEEPEELSEGMLKEFRDLLPSWKPIELKKEELESEVSIAPTNFTEEQISELKVLVGEQNLDLDAVSRIKYSHGGAGEDIIRVRTANFSLLTEAVVHPETEEQIIEIMKFCEKYNLSLIVVGGRTGVTRATNLAKPGIVMDLRPHFTKIINFDKEELLVKVQAGILGPELEKYLQARGCTLSHFPQSFEQSCVGGWIASRSAGQNSSLVGKIEDMVINLRVCTPRGTVESHLSPARATGPQWFRYFIGSEGTLGVITEATLKIRIDESKNRKFASFMFHSFQDGINAMREINQGEFIPAIGRLSCGNETQAYLLLNREGKTRLKDKIIDFGLKMLNFLPMQRAVFLAVFEGSKEYVKKAK
ncbi:MAG: FAD-binding oxidoreductase, partial [Candidatus Heimdallarchaeaceae archaeon]